MLKPLVLFIFLGLFSLKSIGQDCAPNDTIPDSLLGVFPMPYEATTNPTGGIKDTACVGFEFSFVFTAIVGDSFTLGQTTLPLDSMWLDKSSALTGLPSGLSYACDPPTCVFPKNSKGCVVLYGKPNGGTEGIHQMKISGKLYANGSSFGLPLTFPDPDIAPGEYAIVVAEEGEGPCKTIGINEESKGDGITVFPNPFNKELKLSFLKETHVKVIDVYGRVLYNELVLEKVLNTGSWNSGIYFVQAGELNEGNFIKLIKN